MAAHPSGAWEPALPRGVFENAAVDLPGRATIVGAKEHARGGPDIDVSSSSGRPGSMCHAALSVSPDSWGNPIWFDRVHVLPVSTERWIVDP